MTTKLCQGEGCRRDDAGGRARRRTAVGSRLCRSCQGRLTAGLGELAHLYEECGTVLGGARPDTLREKTTGGVLPGLPFNGEAAEVRARMLSTLGSWSGLVAQARGVTPPPRTVPRLTAFLLRHSQWLLAHTAAPEASEEVARLVRQGRRVAFPDPTRRIRLGSCPEAGCTGTLELAFRTHTRAVSPGIQCDADAEHHWDSRRWSELSLVMDSVPVQAPPGADEDGTDGTGRPAPAPATERWLSAAGIAQLWQAPVGTVYRLASEERWRRKSRAGRTYYSENDVRESFGRRAAKR
ncbi:hypothetical protein [Streptomyces sp. NPDC048603]|uniref:hypothetical protein n=1 Tax=Streptomyces sp. NPDC048603 TaxID=3365577 RepID=UPI0037235F72